MTSVEVLGLIPGAPDGATKAALGQLAGRLREEERRAEEIGQFRRNALSPERWAEVAEELLRAAELLVEPISEELADRSEEDEAARRMSTELAGLSRAQGMAVAFAIEGAFKSVLVEDSRVKVTDDGRLEGEWKSNGHDLELLAELAGYIPQDEGEASLLRGLSHFSVWVARYPVPMSSAKFVEAQGPRGVPDDHPDTVRFAQWIFQWSHTKREEIRAAKAARELQVALGGNS